MTACASDLMLRTVPILHAARLDAAVQDYTGAMGFEIVQYVPGVLAVLRIGEVHLYLWQHGADVQNGKPVTFKPGHHRVAVTSAFDAHTGLLCTLNKPRNGAVAGELARLPCRLSGPPQLQPWGAWEFSLTDADGNVLDMVEWVVSHSVASPKLKAQSHKVWREVLPGLRRKL